MTARLVLGTITSISGNTARVTFIVKRNGASANTDTANLVKVKGNWKVDHFNDDPTAH